MERPFAQRTKPGQLAFGEFPARLLTLCYRCPTVPSTLEHFDDLSVPNGLERVSIAGDPRDEKLVDLLLQTGCKHADDTRVDSSIQILAAPIRG